MKYFFAVSILFLLNSCKQKNLQSQNWDRLSVIQEVNQMFDDYHSDIRTEGLTAEFKYLDTSDEFFWIPPGFNSALLYDSVKSILQTNARIFNKSEFHWETLQIFPLSDRIATFNGIVKGIMTDTSGIESDVHILESGTVVNRSDGWKLLCGQSVNLTDPRPIQNRLGR